MYSIYLKAINQVLIKEGQANLKAIKVACSRESLEGEIGVRVVDEGIRVRTLDTLV